METSTGIAVDKIDESFDLDHEDGDENINPPSAPAVSLFQRQDVDEKEEEIEVEEQKGVSWRMLLEFYGVLDLAALTTYIVLAFAYKKHDDMRDLWIFLASLYVPNLICFILILVTDYGLKYLNAFKVWIDLRLVLLMFILPGVIFIIDAKELECRVCAMVFDGKLEDFQNIMKRDNFTLMASTMEDSLNLQSLPVSAAETKQDIAVRDLQGWSRNPHFILSSIEHEINLKDEVVVKKEKTVEEQQEEFDSQKSKGLIWTDVQVKQYEFELCASIVVFLSLIAYVICMLYFGFQMHILNMTIAQFQMAAEQLAEKERKNQRLEAAEIAKVDNLRLLKIELKYALKAIKGEDSTDSDASDHDAKLKTGIN